jgi:hypothetical protein
MNILHHICSPFLKLLSVNYPTAAFSFILRAPTRHMFICNTSPTWPILGVAVRKQKPTAISDWLQLKASWLQNPTDKEYSLYSKCTPCRSLVHYTMTTAALCYIQRLIRAGTVPVITRCSPWFRLQPQKKNYSILRDPEVHYRVYNILILSTHLRLGLLGGLFHSGFLTNNIHAFIFSPICATCRAHLILLDLIIVIIPSEE